MRLRASLFLLLGCVMSAKAQSPPVTLSISVGQTSSVQTATLTFTAASVAGSPFTINVLKQGAPGLDFNLASGGTCSPSATYNIGDTCTVNYTFSPLHPGVQNGAVSLTVGTTPLATAYISGIGQGPQLNYLPPQQLTLGGYITGSASGIAVDGAGNVFIAEMWGPSPGNPTAGEIAEIPKGCTNWGEACVVPYISQTAMAEIENSSGVGAPPEEIAIDGAGNLYVGFQDPPNPSFDTGLYEFPRGCTAGACALPIGSGLHVSFGIAVDGSGNVYAASNTGIEGSTFDIQKIPPGCGSTSCMTTISGVYGAIWAVAADGYGNVFFSGSTQNGAPAAAYEIPAGCTDSSCLVSLVTPITKNTEVSSVTVDDLGNLFYSDYYDLYEIPAGCNTSSCSLTLHTGYEDLIGPNLATDGSNNVYAMDGQAGAGFLYELDLTDPPNLSFPTTAQDSVSPQQTVTLRNGGNQPFSFSPPATYGPNPVISQYFTLDTTSAGTCGAFIGSNTTPTLQTGDTCTLPIDFAPVSPASGTINGTLTLADNNLNVNNATQVISLTGDAVLAGLTSAVLSSSINPSSLGQSVTFTASITSLSGTPTGSITFTDGSTTLATVTLNSTGTASMTDSALTVGTHTITANYVPTGIFLASNATLSQQVNPDVAVDVLTANPSPAPVGSAVTLSATVTASPVGTTPTGTVTFTSNGDNLATVSLVGGVATYSTTSLSVGTNTLGCVYSGDSNYASTSCQSVSETVTTPATLALVSSANPAAPYTSIQFTATLTGNGQHIDNDLVTFTIDGVVVGSKYTNTRSQALLLSQDGLAPGQHTVVATSSVFGPYASGTASLTETVNQAPSTSTLTLTPTTATAGSPVTLTATLGGSLDDQVDGLTLTPTGTVTFSSNGTVLSTVTIANSTAIYTTSALPPGTDNITCTYSGDSNFAASTCNSASVTVSPIVSTLTVTPSSNPSPALSAVTFSASLLGGGAPLGGAAVAFAVDGTNVATATTNAQGVATYTSSTLGVGQHTVTATFAGSGSYTGTQSAALNEQIQANPTTTTLSASPNPIQQGQPLTVSVAVSAMQGTAAPTGTVALVQGTTQLATATLTTPSSGLISTATISISSLPAGSDSIQVNYTPADGNFVASSSSLSTVNVDVPDFSLAANPTSLDLTTRQSGSATITVTSLGLFAGQVQISCGSGLPQYLSCSFAPAQLTLAANGTPSTTLTINTEPTQTAFRGRASRLNAVFLALLAPLSFLGFRRSAIKRDKVHSAVSLLLLACAAVLLSSLGGCGSHVDSTSPGTYTIPITVSGTNNGSSTATSHTLNYTVVIGQ